MNRISNISGSRLANGFVLYARMGLVPDSQMRSNILAREWLRELVEAQGPCEEPDRVSRGAWAGYATATGHSVSWVVSE